MAPLPAHGLKAKAQKLERSGDLAGALEAWQTALAGAPGDLDILTGLARLAERMEMFEAAEQLWAQVAQSTGGAPEAVDGQARALRELGRFDEAVEQLRATLMLHPQEPRLWNTLGATLTQASQSDAALTFLDEAVRLDPRFAVALYNRGSAYFDLGRLDEAAADFALARKFARRPADIAMIDFAAATLMLAQGRLATGWEAYESRFSRDLQQPVLFDVPGRRWTPSLPLGGKAMLVVAEQGLGDELMFAGLLPDLIAELGPQGRLTVAVERRLVPLFRRAFAGVEVLAHATTAHAGRRRRSVEGLAPGVRIDLWAPLASLARRYRTRLDAFPDRACLAADPARVAHWRGWLGEGPPAVGISWRSGKLLGDRRRHYPPLEAWRPVLEIPGVRFVDIQYGDVTDELPLLAALSGGRVAEPPRIDRREDIDDLAALVSALDLNLCVANATGALAGAVGAPVVLLCAPAAWPQLGAAPAYPWYPQARAVAPAAFGQWTAPMQALAEAVRALG